MKRQYLVVACLLFASLCSAGQSSPPPNPPETKTTSPAAQTSSADAQASIPQAPSAQAGDKQQGKDNQATTNKPAESDSSKDRLFFALPNYLTVESTGQVPPLTAGQKFKVVARTSFDYVQVPWYGFLAGIGQAENSEPGFGQGAAGYGKRFGAYFADGTIENFLAGAILPTVFREDPRYFRSGRGSFWGRMGYSVSRLFITRTDSGHSQFNVSEVFGSVMAAGISTYSYHPRGDHTLSNTASVWGTELSYDTLTLGLREFWPDIRRKIKRSH